MSLKNENSENIAKSETNKFFPYKPYPEQILLMNFLTQALLNTKDIDNDSNNNSSPKIILIESPTGTGKTMMLLSSLLEFLDKIKNNKENIENKSSNEDEEDWLIHFGENKEKKEEENIEEDKKKKINEKMDLILSNIKKKINKKDDDDLILNKEDKKMLIKNKTTNPYLTFLNKNNNLSQITQNQIFYCTRTHSQISQIISESKKIYEYYNKNISKFFNNKKFPYPFSFFGSRKQLCINNKINTEKNNINKINILCKEINEEKETRCKYKKFLYEDDFNPNFICEEMKTNIKDIEDLLKFGEEFNYCPYYITHLISAQSQFIVSPYNNILNKRIKNNININLRNNIIVFDEAHNIIENILQNANSDINNKELISLFIGFYLYYNKYKSKLNPANNLCLRQIITIIKIFLDFVKKISKNKDETYINIKLSDFTIENKLNTYDFYKLVNFIEQSQITQKIQWLLQKEITNIKNDKSNAYSKKLNDILSSQISNYLDTKDIDIKNYTKFLNTYLQIYISTSPLNKLCLFLIGILNIDEDGLLIYDTKLNTLRFILINPVRDFNFLLRETKCMIFIGGTMKPFDDFYNLFPDLNKNQILTFEGEHIIKQGSILPYIISNNILSNNEIYTFTYESMKINSEMNIHYLLEYINIYYDLFKRFNHSEEKGKGIVVFFQSYDFIKKIIEYNNKKPILKIEKNNLFWEKKEENANNSNDNKNSININNNNIFESFEKNIKIKNEISILFGVMGGKLSEGINFKDNLCRLLIIVGMPFSNIKSIEIKEKMKYYDKLFNQKKSSINGNEYYENICMKNINQTIGRCIRNYYDFSSIVLIDNRFTYLKYFNKLPKWVTREGKNIIKTKEDFDKHLLKIESFLNNKINS